MRAQAAALYVTVTTLVGLGLGPSIVGVLTDQVFGADSAVRYSLAILTVAGLAASATLLAMGLGPYRRSVAYRDAWMRSTTSGTR